MTGALYLLEGADAAGKTSLAEELLAGLDESEYVYLHNDASDAELPGRLDLHYAAQLRDMAELAARGATVVVDRTWPSEVVYGAVYRDGSRVTRRQSRRLARLADRLGAHRIGVVSPWRERRARMLERGETPDLQAFLVGGDYLKHFQLEGWDVVERGSAHTAPIKE